MCFSRPDGRIEQYNLFFFPFLEIFVGNARSLPQLNLIRESTVFIKMINLMMIKKNKNICICISIFPTLKLFI